MKKYLVVGFLALASSRVFAWPVDYKPVWNVGDSWQVTVTYKVDYPKGPIILSTNAPTPVYPYDQYYSHVDKQGTYTYTVVTNAAPYDYRAPLYNPFVSTPGHLNEDKNRTQVTIIDAIASSNSHALSSWELFFETNTTLLEIREITSNGGDGGVNPYGKEAWLTWFIGNKESILDFPNLPSTETNEIRVVEECPRGGSPVTQSVNFSGDVATVVLSRTNSSYKMLQKATFTWGKGKKWWTTAKVELDTNLVVSAATTFP